MKRLITTLLSCLLLFTSWSQSGLSIKGGDAMQNQLISAYLKAKAMGLSDNEIKNQLIKRGYPAQSFDQIKKMAQNKSAYGMSSTVGQNILDTSSTSVVSKRDSNWVFKTPLPKEISPYYGYSFFTEAFSEYAPNTNIATPENYILGAGDQLIVNVTGINTRTIQGYITPEGYYSLPYVGMVQLNGVSIETAKKIIKQKLVKIYPAITSNTTQLYISLGEIRTIQVMVTGEASRPGNYTVSSLTSLFNLLYLSGGPTDNGSLRSIQLIRNNKVVKEIDFYEFLKSGILNNSNIRLEDQDLIHFMVYKKRVKLEGEVKTNSIFELKEKETLNDLLNLAGGFSENAYSKFVTIKTNEENSLSIKNIQATEYASYILAAGDVVTIGSIDQRFENRVVINGEINRPGVFGLLKNETLKQLIQRAGGIKEDAFANRGFIQRKMPGLSMQMLPFDTKLIIAGKQEDILLVKNDSIVIYSSNNFINNSFVTISGGVRNPGAYIFKNGMKVEDLIALAGGFTIDAAYFKVELSRLEKNNSEILSNQVLQRQHLNIDSNLHISQNSVTLDPFDDIMVPKLLNYRLLGTVKIRGEILYEGDYSLEKRDETVLDIVERSGGISPFASISDLQVFRNGLRVGTDIFNQSMIFQKRDPLMLLPGDSIYIPRKNNFVTIRGAVFNEQLIEYNSSSLMSYISAVGGTKNTANLKKAYVQYPNGMYKKTHRFLFMRFYPTILPGSKIFVPEKTIEDLKSLGVSEITGMATLLTSLVAIYSLLKK